MTERGSAHAMTPARTTSDAAAIGTAATHMPESGAASRAGRNRIAACATTAAGSHSSVNGQNPSTIATLCGGSPERVQPIRICNLRPAASRAAPPGSATPPGPAP